jgi:undecaprenyl diphosphate synthase
MPGLIDRSPLVHVGIIMDGNGRWAEARGLPRTDGHLAGARAIRPVVEAAVSLGIGTLTLYAFSSDNWTRPPSEVRALLSLFEDYLRSETDRCVVHGIRLSVVGRRDRLPPQLRHTIEAVERSTAGGRALHLRLAIDYSGRDAIWRAASCGAGEERWSREAFAARVGSGRGEVTDVPDVDLIIRTGGEQRLSDFLLWESAYAELLFTPTAWPDFTGGHLADAMGDFARRVRRFGALTGGISTASHR